MPAHRKTALRFVAAPPARAKFPRQVQGQLPPPESKARLKDFKPLFLAALTADMDGRRKLRPLLDEVTKAGG